MASEPTVTREMIKAGIEAWAKAANERLDPEHVICAALTAALAVQARTHVVVRRDDAMDVVASLAATISVIERTPQARKAAMSDKAFGIMLDDYTKALARGRAMLAASTEDGK